MGIIQEGSHLQNETRAELAIRNLAEFKKRFDPVLASFLAKQIEEVENIRPELEELLTLGADFVLAGGKRLRPAFFYYGYRGAGGEEEESILAAACSVELVHAGALIHDDIIDNSGLRRGGPTVHTAFARRFRDPHFGESLAILTGDAIAAMASHALDSFPTNYERIRAARNYFNQMCLEINLGQFLDVLGDSSAKIDVDWVLKVMRFKTAGYTVEKPLLIGASLAGASFEGTTALSNYAIPLGIAFQIQDDILGMFGDEKKVGKPVDSDLREGKKTLLVLKTLEKLEQEGRKNDSERFNSILGNPQLTPDDYRWVQNLMVSTGALEEVRRFAQDLIKQSQKSLGEASLGGQAGEYLLGIADYTLSRDY